MGVQGGCRGHRGASHTSNPWQIHKPNRESGFPGSQANHQKGSDLPSQISQICQDLPRRKGLGLYVGERPCFTAAPPTRPGTESQSKHLTPLSARATSNQKAQAQEQAPKDLAEAPDLDGPVSCRPFPISSGSQPHASYPRAHPSPPPPRSTEQTRDRIRRERAASQIAVRMRRSVISIQHLHHTAATKIALLFHRLHQLHLVCMQVAN